jgi:UDP-glucose 4-epimerase
MLFHQLWNLPVTVLRPAMVYGPSQPDRPKLLP